MDIEVHFVMLNPRCCCLSEAVVRVHWRPVLRFRIEEDGLNLKVFPDGCKNGFTLADVHQWKAN